MIKLLIPSYYEIRGSLLKGKPSCVCAPKNPSPSYCISLPNYVVVMISLKERVASLNYSSKKLVKVEACGVLTWEHTFCVGSADGSVELSVSLVASPQKLGLSLSLTPMGLCIVLEDSSVGSLMPCYIVQFRIFSTTLQLRVLVYPLTSQIHFQSASVTWKNEDTWFFSLVQTPKLQVKC